MTIESEAYASHVWSFSYVAYDMTLEPSASYDVRLGFAETYLPNCAEGSRLFNIQVGLEAILEDVDVWKEAGCFAAHDIVFTNVIASDTGLLTVNVTKGREQNPFLSLIEVTPSVSTTDHSDANSISPSQFPAISPSTVGGVYDNLLTRVNFGSSSSIEGYDNPESSKLTGLPGINSFGGAGTVISGATVNDVYASHVWAWEELRYSLDVDATRQYDVKVMVAESYTPNCYVGQRVFHLAVGDQRKDDIDVFDQAGCATALSIEFSNVIPDSEGKLEIAALKKPDADNPFISAVEVSYSSGSAPGQIASTFLPSAAPLSGAESASVAPSGHVSLAPSQIESLPPSTIESVSPSSVDSLEPSEALPPTSFPTYVPTLYPSALPTPPAAANEPIIKVHFGRRQRAADGYDFPQPTNLNGTINWFAGYGIPIAGTNAVGAYASHVWSDTYAGYKMVLDSSKLYTVRVGFAESYEPNCVVGKRIFNLQVGSQLVSDIDVFREAGCKTAYNVTLNNVVPLSSGVLEVVVTKGDADNAFMSLVEVMLAS